MSVYARLAASLVALAAGIAGVVVAVDLLRSVPGPTSPTAATPAPAGQPPAPVSIAGGRIPTPNEPAFPSPPPGAVVLSREAGPYALGVAVAGRLVRVSVVSPDGPGARGLDVRVAAEQAKPCGPGCYQASLGRRPTSPLAIAVAGTIYRFALPRTAVDASEIANRAAATWRGLKTLVWHERLAGSPTVVIHTLYRAVAPDGLSYTIAGGSAAVIIGGTRWDRATPGAPWRRSEQSPPLSQPVPFWVTSLDAHVLGSGRYAGRRAWRVSFFDPDTPAWFAAWIDQRNYRTLELDMNAASHFMHHVYGPFDAPLRLERPAGATRP